MGWDGMGSDAFPFSALLRPTAAAQTIALRHCVAEQDCEGYQGVLEKWGGGYNQSVWLWGPCWSMLGSQSPDGSMSLHLMASVG